MIPVFHRAMLPPSSLHLEHGGSMTFQNAGILPRHYAASQPRIP